MKLKKYLFIMTLVMIANTAFAMLPDKQATISPKEKRKKERNKFFIVNRLSTPNNPFLCSTQEVVATDEKTGKLSTFIKPIIVGVIKKYSCTQVPHDTTVRQHLDALVSTNKGDATCTIGVIVHRLSSDRNKMRVWHTLPGNLDDVNRATIERLVLIDSYVAKATHITSVDLNTDKKEIIELKENM